jgi:radical SAM protein with 4Fe4S-binding SPASM domain
VPNRDFSIIILPTLNCNASCDYCFEDNRKGRMSHECFERIMDAILAFMETRHIDTLYLYWQGGEVMTLSPAWLERAHRIIAEKTEGTSRVIVNYLQSNMLAYGDEWAPIISTMFGNGVGTSMDFPNRNRHMPGGSTREYTAKWMRKVDRAIEAGIHIGVIALPGEETLELGATKFYAFFAEQAGITDVQVNTPFPGGRANDAKRTLPLDPRALGRFLTDLTDVWLERGYRCGVRVGPSSELLDCLLHGRGITPCYWQDNCASGFFCIDPHGFVSQCDCWSASYPQMRFGNVFEEPLTALLERSDVRQAFLARPGSLVRHGDCIECRYLSLCHGGCPVRAFSTYGRLDVKDPYCEVYKALFAHMERVASRIGGT